LADGTSRCEDSALLNSLLRGHGGPGIVGTPALLGIDREMFSPADDSLDF